MAQKSVKCLAKCKLEISLLLTEFTKIIRNGILRVQCTITTLLYWSTKSEHSP
jgi:hypothetical protein